MENDDTKKSGSKASKELRPITPKLQTDTKGNSPKESNKQSRKHQKWSLKRHWKAASRKQQVKWVAEGIGGLIALGVLVTYIWSNLQTKWNFQAEHRPIVIHSRPPNLVQSLSCDPARGLHIGNMQEFVKNVGRGTASNVFEASDVKVVPEQKLGNGFWDDPPSVGPENCSLGPRVLDPKITSSIAPGEEKVAVMREAAWNTPPFHKGASAQIYMTSCVFYSDEDTHYGTCDTYRLFVPSDNPLDQLLGTPTVACDGKEVTGKFVSAFAGHCQN